MKLDCFDMTNDGDKRCRHVPRTRKVASRPTKSRHQTQAEAVDLGLPKKNPKVAFVTAAEYSLPNPLL